ncbi:hypothetical protein D3C76_1348790 [compost metagenome]
MALLFACFTLSPSISKARFELAFPALISCLKRMFGLVSSARKLKDAASSVYPVTLIKSATTLPSTVNGIAFIVKPVAFDFRVPALYCFQSCAEVLFALIFAIVSALTSLVSSTALSKTFKSPPCTRTSYIAALGKAYCGARLTVHVILPRL